MIKINTHVQDARKRLLFQFRNKKRIEALITAPSKQIQEIEDAAHEFYQKRSLQNATGATLDRYGRIFDEPRRSLNDADYRANIFFRIRRNMSNGTPEEQISILLDLTQSRLVQYVSVYPAAYRLTFIGAQNQADLNLVSSIMQSLSPSGVKLISVSEGSATGAFAFAGHPDAQARGLDTLPVQEIGGLFISII